MIRDLKEYQNKRDFNKTKEPKGQLHIEGGRNFVVQLHYASSIHYDLRLEHDGVLMSWAVPKGPSFHPADKRLAIRVEDHPIEYRLFEGIIPEEEYGAGTVLLWDQGIWQPLGDVEEGLKKGVLEFRLDGQRLHGNWVLVRLKKNQPEDKNWLLIKEKDNYALENEGIADYQTSVLSGLTQREIEEKHHLGAQTAKRNTDDSLWKIPASVHLTGLNKRIYPTDKINKLMVASYYWSIADKMMPYLLNRLVTLLRCPDGLDGEEKCFYQKHPMMKKMDIPTLTVKEKDNTLDEYLYITKSEQILQAVQLGALEFHTWGSRIETLEKPDCLVFDLDPDEGLSVNDIRRGMQDLLGMLEFHGLRGFLKTSGGKDYHLIAPIQVSASWEEVREFSLSIALQMAEKWPDRYTANVRKQQRKNKILVDWLRNSRGSTIVVPYSLRARKGAAISMPIATDDLFHILPDEVTIKNFQQYCRTDPWIDFFRIRQFIPRDRVKGE